MFYMTMKWNSVVVLVKLIFKSGICTPGLLKLLLCNCRYFCVLCACVCVCTSEAINNYSCETKPK